MRSLLFLVLLTLCGALSASAQSHDDHQHNGALSAEAIDADIPYGTYGYLHGYLHEYGTIDDLLTKTDSSCCDGGDGGECRATEIIWKDGVAHFRHAAKWCPLAPGQQIRTDVTLPPDVSAVVCAPYSVPEECPSSTYCASATITN